jgi:SmpA/OmlA family protein
MKVGLGILLCAAMILTGCATAPKMNQLSVGMTKQEVVKIMGQPASTASPGHGIELLRYHLSETGDQAYYGFTQEYFVKLVGGKVDSYGKLGDFDSTKDPTLNVNVKNK